MPRVVERWEPQYCYCMPPRYALVKRVEHTWAERRAMLVQALADLAWGVTRPVTAPVEWFARWITASAPLILMAEGSTEPMCGRSFVAELADLNRTLTAEEMRVTQAEASRTLHRTLFDAIKQADTHRQGVEAVKAWDAHIAEHREQAQAIRVERARAK